MTIEQTRRELFEAGIKMPIGVKWCADQERYVGVSFWIVEFAWDAFNAALDAVVIDLEPAVRTMPCPPIGGTMWTPEVYAAIESTGLGLKVLP